MRQQAKVIEIKLAIEKLKGYRIECQSLTLVDEAELFDLKSSLSQQVLQPVMDEIKAQEQNALNGNQLSNMALTEAQFRYARLHDEITMEKLNVFQEFPHCDQWR